MDEYDADDPIEKYRRQQRRYGRLFFAAAVLALVSFFAFLLVMWVIGNFAGA